MVNSILNSNHKFKIRFPNVLLLGCFLLLILQPAFGQLVSEDAKGEEVQVQYLGGSFLVNSANDSIKIGYTLRNKSDWCLGIDVAGKAENGIASLLKNGDLTPNVKINFNIGYVFNSEWKKRNIKVKKEIDEKKKKGEEEINEKYNQKLKALSTISEEDLNQRIALLEKEKQEELDGLNEQLENEAILKLEKKIPKQTSWINLKVGYEKAEFKIFSPEASFDEQIKKKEFNGFSVQLSFQSYLYNYNTLVNLSLGIKRTNNISELKKVEITDETIYGNSVQTTRLNKKSFIAWQGSFETFNMGYILLSSFWKPSQVPLGVLTYGRYNYSSLIRSMNLGIGGYILTPKESNTRFVPLGGILVEYEDKFDSGMEDISFGDRFTISLVVSIPFLTN